LPLLKRATCIRYEYADETQSGWLPPGSAASSADPARRITLDVTIEYEPGDGFILAYSAREDPTFSFDDWFGSLSAAEAAAEEMFGITLARWQNVELP